MRREYRINIVVNDRQVKKVVIDPQLKHSDVISDRLILKLVRLLNKGTFPATDHDGDYTYFVTDRLKLDEKLYKLVWLLEKDQLYIGVINAYRRKK